MTQPNKSPAPRLFAIFARGSRQAVVFRRGPAKQVQLLLWNRADDSFTPGQWFKGRIYERQCDLSPSGALLVYFAAKHHGPDMNGTVISRPPYLTALARWPVDHTWGGGGLFEDETTLWLNHSPHMDPQLFTHAEVVAAASGLTIKSLGDMVGHGLRRDGWEMRNPIYDARRERDGWQPLQPGGLHREHHENGGFEMRFDPPQIWENAGPDGRRLQELCHGMQRPEKAPYHLTFRLFDGAGQFLTDLGEADWADWDGGDLVYAKDGCVYRLAAGASCPAEAKLLHDFRGTSFSPLEAPAEAMRW